MTESRNEVEEILSISFMAAHPREAAMVLEGVPAQDAATTLAAAPSELAAPVLQYMAPMAGADCLVACHAQEGADILTELPLDVSVRLLRRLEPTHRAELLAAIPPDTKRSAEVLLKYPEKTAGALMVPRVLILPDDLTVAQARKHARRHSRFLRYYLYVINREQELVGVSSLRELMLAAAGVSLSTIMHRPVERLSVSDSRHAILAHPAWRRFHALPVVDSDGSLVGVVRYETVRELEGSEEQQPPPNATSLALALGELYWIGATSVAEHLLGALGSRAKSQPKEESDVS
jgi:magnesium transporter